MKVYPDKKTELICNCLFYGSIAVGGLNIVMAVLTALLGKGKWHVALCTIAYVMLAAGCGLFAYAARIGMRPKFGKIFFIASIAVFLGGAAFAGDYGRLFGSDTSLQALCVVFALLIMVLVLLSSVLLFGVVGKDGIDNFFELTNDRKMCIGFVGSIAASGLMAILASIIKKGDAWPAIWEVIGMFLLLTAVFAIPLIFLLGCNRINDPITDRELEDGGFAEDADDQGCEGEEREEGRQEGRQEESEEGRQVPEEGQRQGRQEGCREEA